MLSVNFSHLNAMNYIYNNHGNDPMIVLGNAQLGVDPKNSKL